MEHKEIEDFYDDYFNGVITSLEEKSKAKERYFKYQKESFRSKFKDIEEAEEFMKSYFTFYYCEKNSIERKEKVYKIIPGSSGLYYRYELLSIESVGGGYSVIWSDFPDNFNKEEALSLMLDQDLIDIHNPEKKKDGSGYTYPKLDISKML